MRLFVAVDLDENVRNNIWTLSEELAGMQGLKIVERENLHITLQFLGEVNKRRCELVKDELGKVSFEPFKIKLAGVGAFPSATSPRVVWVDVKEGKEELKRLADNVYEKLRRLGFRRDKEFVAHVTVARVKRKNPNVPKLLSKYAKAEFGEMLIDKFKLKQSILRPQGPLYKDVGVFEP